MLLIFFLIASAQSSIPSISHFSPTTGKGGATVTVTGKNFSNVIQNNIVRFGGVKATVTQADSTSLTVTVPTGAMYAPISVTTNGLSCLSSRSFNPVFTGGGSISTASFLPKVDYPILSAPVSVALGDLNGNGSLDVIIFNYGSSSLSIYRNLSKRILLT